MKKLLSLLFAIVIVFSLATRALAQPGDPAKGQGADEHAKKAHVKKTKHHKRKHKHIVEVKGQGSVKGDKASSIGSNA
ncbi:MAG TPA: hypothetical protein VKO18_07305 [Terriglobia bacterium]|nr:hypothetical protein [Terriglobia bacterium]